MFVNPLAVDIAEQKQWESDRVFIAPLLDEGPPNARAVLIARVVQ